MSLLYKRIYNDHQSALIEVDYKDIKFDQPTLICLPGQYAVGNKIPTRATEADVYQREMFGMGDIFSASMGEAQVKRSISGFLKRAERIIGGSKAIESGLEMFLVSYKDNINNEITLENMRLYNKDPENYYSEEAGIFAAQTILPLIIDGFKIKASYKSVEGGGKESIGDGWKIIGGIKKDFSTVLENLSKVNLFAYSYGAVFAGEACNFMKRAMAQIGYKESEIKEALGRIDVVATGSTLQTANKDSMLFRCFLVEAVNDVVVKSNIPKYVESIKKNKDFPYIEKVNDNILRLVVENPSKADFFTYQDSKPVKTEEDNLKRHKFRLYSSYKLGHDNVAAVLVENVTRNMIKGPYDPNIDSLTKFAEPLIPEDQKMDDKYRAVKRIYEKYVSDLIQDSSRSK